MHSFHHSRGRILFEAACALTISASCVGAWMELGVPAFLAAAGVSALYGLVRLFDIRGRKPAVAFVAPGVGPEAESQGNLLEYVDSQSAEFAAEATPWSLEPVEAPAPAAEAVAVVEPEQTRAPRPKKRRSKKPAAVAEVEPVPEVEPADEDAPAIEVAPIEIEPVAEVSPVELPVHEEPEDHAPVTPLFEPEPFVRQQRAVFGRKAG